MAKQFTVISGNRPAEARTILLPEEKFKHFRNVMGVVLQDAQKTWGELWDELQGEVVDSVMVRPDAEHGFRPKSGWPEFLEKMWILRHQLDYARRFSEGRM